MAKRATGYKEFQYNGFTVLVPHSVLAVWEVMPDRHQREMIEVVRGHYNRLANKPITDGVSLKLQFGRMPGEPLSQTAKKMANPGVKEAVLNLLRYPNYRNWHLSPIRNDFTRAVLMAALDGDQSFFRRLGEILKKPCKPTARMSKLRELLLFNWAGTGICFCWFTDSALLNFIKLTEKDGAPFAMDAIRQERNWLGLPKLKPALVRSIVPDGKRILLNRSKSPSETTPFIAGLALADYLADETETTKRMRSAAAKTRPDSQRKCGVSTNMEWRQPSGRRRRRPGKHATRNKTA